MLNSVEQKIFNALISKRPKFIINQIEFVEKIITGTEKERERKCKNKAQSLAKLLQQL